MTLWRIAGTVLGADNGGVVVVPTSPQPSVDNQFAVPLTGRVPLRNGRVELYGTWDGSVFRVARHSQLTDGLGPVWSTPKGVGVDRDTAQAVAVSFPEHWGLVSGGVSMTESGGHVALIEVHQMTSEIDSCVSSQPTGSVVVHPFIALIAPER